MQAAVAFEHHLTAIHRLVPRAVDVGPAHHADPGLQALADASPDDSPFRSRRAVPACTARRPRPTVGDGGAASSTTVPGPLPHTDLAPYDSADEAARRPRGRDRVAALARRRDARRRTRRPGHGVRSATFGTHLCGLDMRQNSAVHEVVIDELFRVGGVDRGLPVPRRRGPHRRAHERARAAPGSSPHRTPTTRTRPAASWPSSARPRRRTAGSGRERSRTT